MAHSVPLYKRDDYGWTYVDYETLHLTELSRGYDDLRTKKESSEELFYNENTRGR